MSAVRPAGFLALAVACLTTTVSAQQGNVAVTCAACEAGTSATPPFAIFANNFAGGGPYRYTLQVDTSSRFTSTRFVVDSTFTSNATVVSVAPAVALPEQTPLFYRARVVDASGTAVTSSVAGPFKPPFWVTLVSPALVPGRPLRTLQPRFVWTSPTVNEPPGPWEYRITIAGAGSRQVTSVGTATTFTPGATALEANAVYQLSIEVRLPRAAQSSISGPYTFTTEDTTLAVSSTQLYRSFPNPFPYYIGGALYRDATCIWFDLKNPGTVSLDVYSLRGILVRRLVPNAELSGSLPAGRYGRGRAGTNEACDPGVQWDGRDERGSSVPEGVYIIRFRADGIESSKKVLFRGR